MDQDQQAAQKETETLTFFVYGTLMHPPILHRVLKTTNPNNHHLTLTPAFLPTHTRHGVKGADFPAIVEWEVGLALIGKVDGGGDEARVGGDGIIGEDGKGVRGVLVEGVTIEEGKLLDQFEGKMYTRTPVEVIPLSTPQESTSPNTANDNDNVNEQKIPAIAYVWTDRLEYLKPEIWSYEGFLRDKARMWE